MSAYHRQALLESPGPTGSLLVDGRHVALRFREQLVEVEDRAARAVVRILQQSNTVGNLRHVRFHEERAVREWRKQVYTFKEQRANFFECCHLVLPPARLERPRGGRRCAPSGCAACASRTRRWPRSGCGRCHKTIHVLDRNCRRQLLVEVWPLRASGRVQLCLGEEL